MTPKTKQEIIQETRDFYAADPKRRAANNGSCFYQTEDGRNCAVGRCLIPNSEMLASYGPQTMFLCGGAANYIRNLEEILKEEYRGHEPDFWRELQLFHDNRICWSLDGISPKGEEQYSRLMKKYAE
jgi:hypothetical protein